MILYAYEIRALTIWQLLTGTSWFVGRNHFMTDFLEKDEFFGVITDLPAEAVEIKDAKGEVRGLIRMRGLTVDELTEYQNKMTVTLSSGQRKPNTKHAMALLVVYSAINEDGSPYFTNHDISRLEQGSARILMPCFNSAQRLCGLTDEDMEEMTSNFEETKKELSDSD